MAESPDNLPVPLYHPEAMVQLILQNPSWDKAKLAKHFGKPESWFSSVLASERFQQAIEPYRANLPDPSLTATMEERVKAMAIRSMDVLLVKMDSKEASDLLVLKAAELGIKGLGMGQIEKPKASEAPASTTESIAEKLIAALEKQRANSRLAEPIDITPKVEGSGS